MLKGNEEDKPLLNEEEITTYKRRWVMLLVYTLNALANNVCFITFGPIDKSTANVFNQGLIEVNLMSAQASFFSIFFTIPFLWCIKKYGLRPSMIFCGISNCLSGVLRIVVPIAYSGNPSAGYFWLIFVSQVISGLCNPVITAIPPQISGNWFPVSERAVATSIASLATLVGLASSYALSGFVIGNVEKNPCAFDTGHNATSNVTSLVALATRQQDADNFYWLFVGQGIFFVVAGITALFFQSHPPTPPSLTSENDHNGMTMMEELKVRAYFCSLKMSYGSIPKSTALTDSLPFSWLFWLLDMASLLLCGASCKRWWVSQRLLLISGLLWLLLVLWVPESSVY